MSESHLTHGGGPSSDLVAGPKANTGMSRHPSEGHPGRLWTRKGLARLPPELIDPICKHLCGCWHCGPRGHWAEHVRNDVQHRNALNSLSRTCRFLCSIAQPYLFHVLETPSLNKKYHRYYEEGDYDKDLKTIDRFRNISVELPHILGQIRRITLISITDDLFILRRLTGLVTLRLLRASNVGDGLQNRLSFPSVRNFFYGPQIQSAWSTFKGYKVGLEDSKKDLQEIIVAAPRLSCLECNRLWHDVSSAPTIPLELPAGHITKLVLNDCWLPHETLKSFMANFPRLKTFRLGGVMPLAHTYSPEDRAMSSMPAHGPERIADAIDVVEALEPCEESLETLVLDFGFYPFDPCFRSLSPIKTFTNLRTVNIQQFTFSKIGKDDLFKLLPKSLEILRIMDFREDYNYAILEFAKHLAEGEYPNLQCVSIAPGGPVDDWHIPRYIPRYISGKSFLAFASGQDAPKLEAHNDHPHTKGIDINPYQRLPGEGGDDDADGGSEEDVGTALDPDDLMRQQEWVWFGRRCLKNNCLMSNLVRQIREDSKIFIRSSLRDVSLRKEIGLLLLETNVRLECASVYTGASDDYNWFCRLWATSPINRRSRN